MTSFKIAFGVNKVLKCNSISQFSFLAAKSKASFHTGRSRMAQTKVTVSGIDINYEKVGNGSHPVLCLPGALGFIESDFGPILPKFDQSKFTVICWDPPGYGKSRPPKREFSGGPQFFHRDAVWANDLMKNLGFENYSMLGWSDGANTACVLASKFPSAVRKLVIWGGNAYITDADMKLYNQVANIDNWSERMKAPMIKMYGEKYFRENWLAWTNLFAGIYKNGGDIFKSEVSKIVNPTFVIHGMKDAMVPYEHADYFKQNIKDSRLFIFEDGKHNLHLKYGDQFVKLVEDFLEPSS